MAWLGRRSSYDRSRILADARRAARGEKVRRAVALYRRVLAAEPGNADLHREVAPLLARTGRRADAWASYHHAAEYLVQWGRLDRAAEVYREAVRHLPREVEAWRGLARLELRRGRRGPALETLLEGRRRFQGWRQRRQAAALLLDAREIQPGQFDLELDLARLLAGTGARGQARRLLEELASRCRGDELRRVRARQLRLAPSPAAAWRYLAALAGTG